MKLCFSPFSNILTMFIVDTTLSLKHFFRCIKQNFISNFSKKKKRIQYKNKLERSEEG